MQCLRAVVISKLMAPRADFRILVKSCVENFDFSGEYLGVFVVSRVNLGGLGAS